MKKRIALILAFVLVFAALTAMTVSAEEGMPDLSGVQNVFIYNLENAEVLYSKNEDDRIYPASAVKIMTGILAVEFFEGRYADLITVTEEALGDFKGKNIKLKVGEVVSVENLLYSVIVGGANDAANVLAYEISGSHQYFLDHMNYKAGELGMENTFYTNAYGYSDPNMYTTAADTAKLAQYAFGNQTYMDICNSARYVFAETNMSKTRYVYNSSSLISTNVETKYRNKLAQGMSAGSTVEGGYVVVTAVSQKGMTDIFVLMGGSYDDETNRTYVAANELIDWAYDSFGYRKVLDSGEMVCEIDVNLSGQVDYVVLSPERSVEHFLPLSADLEKDIKREVELFESSLDAPIPTGYVAGKMTLTYKGKVIDEVDLITKNSVERNGLLYVLARIKVFTRSAKFKIVFACVVIAVLLYVGGMIYNKTKSKRYRYKYRGQRRRR